MVSVSTKSLSRLFLTLLYISLLSRFATVVTAGALREATGEGGRDKNADFAQVVINNREYRIEIPRLSGSDVEEQLQYFHPQDTCVPSASGSYNFRQPIAQVDSARLISGPPGFGFVLWSDASYEYISGTVDWNRPNLERPPIPWLEETTDPADDDATVQPDFLMRQAGRIIWWIRQEPSNDFVAIAQYADTYIAGPFGAAGLVGEYGLRDFPLETRILDFASVSISHPDWFIHRRRRVARWKVSSLYGGKNVFRLAVPEMPTAEVDGYDRAGLNDIADPRNTAELRCYAEPRRSFQTRRMVWPDQCLFVDDNSIKDLVCYSKIVRSD